MRLITGSGTLHAVFASTVAIPVGESGGLLFFGTEVGHTRPLFFRKQTPWTFRHTTMPRTTLPRRGDGGGGHDRWNAAEDFEREARRARNAAKVAERGSLAAALPAPLAAPVLDPVVQPTPRADEEATELANDDNGHASSLGDDDAIEEAPGDAAGDDVQAPFHSPAATVHQPSESWSRSGRGKKPPAKRHRKVLRDNMYERTCQIDHPRMMPTH